MFDLCSRHKMMGGLMPDGRLPIPGLKSDGISAGTAHFSFATTDLMCILFEVLEGLIFFPAWNLLRFSRGGIPHRSE